MATKRAAEEAGGLRKEARSDQMVVLRCGPAGEHVFTRPLSDIERYPDSLLVSMLKVQEEANGGSEELSAIELDLGAACEPRPLEVALHVHSTGSICGAPLPADVTLDWLRTEVLQRYRLPRTQELGSDAGADLEAFSSSFAVVSRLLRQAALESAVMDIIRQADPLAHVPMYHKYLFLFSTEPGQPTKPVPRRLDGHYDLEARVFAPGDACMALMRLYTPSATGGEERVRLARLPEATQGVLEEMLQRALPGCVVTWQRREAALSDREEDREYPYIPHDFCEEDVDKDDKLYDLMTLTWG